MSTYTIIIEPGFVLDAMEAAGNNSYHPCLCGAHIGMGTTDKQISNIYEYEMISSMEKENTRKWGTEKANMGGVPVFESKPCRNLGED